MTDNTSTYSGFLRALYNPAIAAWNEGPHPFFELLESELKAQFARDNASLEAMTPHARQVEVTRRRIVKCEQRFRAALDFTRYDDGDDW